MVAFLFEFLFEFLNFYVTNVAVCDIMKVI